MKPMIKYNRALDLVALALNELTAKKNPTLAARLLAKAAQQPDVQAAIATIEATNRVAHANMVAARTEAKKVATTTASKSRIRATEEMTDEDSEFPVETMPEPEGEIEADFDFDSDPLDEVEDETEEEAAPPVNAGKQMAAVLSKMTRRRDGK